MIKRLHKEETKVFIMSSVDNSTTENIGVVNNEAGDTFEETDIRSGELPNNDANINPSPEELANVTGILHCIYDKVLLVLYAVSIMNRNSYFMMMKDCQNQR